MNSAWELLMTFKGGISKRPLTYAYLTSCRNVQHLNRSSFLRQQLSGVGRQNANTRKPLLHGGNGQLRCPLENCSQTTHYSSSIFVSDRYSEISSSFEYDLDLKERLSDIKELKENLNKRGIDIDVDQLRQDYREYLDLDKERKRLESKREDVASQIAEIVNQQKQSGTKTKSKEQISQMKSLKEEGKDAKICLKQLMIRYWDIEEKVTYTGLSLPNNLSTHVPKDVKVLEEHFQDKKPASVDHDEVLRNSNMVRLSNVGHKAYYLTGRLAVLEQELINYFSTQLRSHDIRLMAAPEMFKTPVVESGCIDVLDPASVYRLQNKQGTSDISEWNTDHMFLHGTSHLSFLSYFARMELSCKDLPIKMFAVGRNYIPENIERRELPGLYGVLQSMKVYMCAVCNSRESCTQMMELFTHLLSQLYQQFQLPFRLVSLPVTMLTAAEENRLELQMWVPSLQQYLKIGAVSMCGDYNSRRLMIRASQNNHIKSSKPVHMVHCEVTDITRLIALLLEYQHTDDIWDS